jgi:hypothetical protein
VQFLLLPRLELLVRILMRQLGKLCFGSQELSSLLCEDNGPDTRQPVESALKLYAFGLVPLFNFSFLGVSSGVTGSGKCAAVLMAMS